MARGPITDSPDLGRLASIARDLFLGNARWVDGHLRWRGTYFTTQAGVRVPSWSFQGRQTTARKWAHELWVGPVKAGELVFAVCDDERCVAPGHTSAGTRRVLVPVVPEKPVQEPEGKTWGKPYVKPVKDQRKIKGPSERRNTVREVVNMTDKFLGWRITDHAKARAQELGFTMNEIMLAAGDPENVYPSPLHGEDNWTHQRGNLTLGVVHGVRVIKTVLLRTERQWQHGHDTVETIRGLD